MGLGGRGAGGAMGLWGGSRLCVDVRTRPCSPPPPISLWTQPGDHPWLQRRGGSELFQEAVCPAENTLRWKEGGLHMGTPPPGTSVIAVEEYRAGTF